MVTFFSVLFVVGLVLNVYFVIRGTERWSRSELALRLDAFGRLHRLGRVSVRVPVLAAFCSALGLTGYLLLRATKLHLGAVLVVALVTAGAAVLSAVLTVKSWAVPHALRDAPDQRFSLQGHIAKVIEPIGAGAGDLGEVSYEVDGRPFRCRARTVDGLALSSGTDVVIERFEDGVVLVEDWSHVERRL